MLLIGLIPASISFLCIQYGDGPTLTSLTTLPQYLLHKSVCISISNDISSSQAWTFISGYFNSFPKVTAASLAIPIIDLQSGLFEVISNSINASFIPKTSLTSIPNSNESWWSSIYIPSFLWSSTNADGIVNSSAPQNIPSDNTPLNLPFFILKSPGNTAPILATGT